MGNVEKEQQKRNNDYVRNKVLKLNNYKRVALYVNSNRSLDAQEKVLIIFKQWHNDYISGKTFELPSIRRIALFCKVSWPIARRIVNPYIKRYFKYNYIDNQEYKDFGLDKEEEFKQIYMGEWPNE